MITTESVNLFFSQLSIFATILLVAAVCIGFYGVLTKRLKKILSTPLFRFVSGKSLLFAFIVALTATLGSLFYSEIAHYTPCKLCWYQRILMYPQVVLLGIAAYRKDRNIVPYAMVLSTIGAVIALYHYLLQIGVVEEIAPCSTVGYSVSCTDAFAMTYGFITIPFMSLIAFLSILALLILSKLASHRK